MYLARVLAFYLIPFVVLAVYLFVSADQDNPTAKRLPSLAWALGAVLSPYVVFTFFLLVSHWLEMEFREWLYWATVALGTTVGLILLNRLSLNKKALVAWSIVLVPIFSIAQILYGLSFVCAAFGDCI